MSPTPPDFAARGAEAVDLLADIERFLLVEAPLAGEGSQFSGVDLPAVAVYVRCRSLLDGALLLVRNGHQENAFLLARSLFEESLWVQALSAEDRGPLALGWFLANLREALNWQRALAESRGEVFEDDGAHQREVERFRRWMAQLGVATDRPLGSAKQLAKDFGRFADEYPVFVHGHMVVHGSLTLLKLMPILKKGVQQLVGRKPDDHFTTAYVTLLAGRSILSAHEAVALLFGWQHDAEALAVLRARLAALDDGWPDSPDGDPT